MSKSKILRRITIVFIAVWFIVPFVLQIMQFVRFCKVNSVTKIVILVGQIISMLLSYLYEKEIDKEIFDKGKKVVLNNLKPLKKKSITQLARDELRLGLKIFVAVITLFFCLICIILEDICLMIIGLAIIGLTFMYSDYIAHAICYARRYDANFNAEKECASSTIGLARIYLTEYKLTKFDRKHALYREIGHYNSEPKNSQSFYQDECIKNILRMYADEIENPTIVYNIVLFAINVLLTIPNQLEIFVDSVNYIWNENIELFRLIGMFVFNTIFVVMNIVQVLSCKSEYTEIKNICDVLLPESNQSQKRAKRRELYNKACKDKKIKEPIIARGLFEFSSSYIDYYTKKHSLESIDLKYRMLFIHKYYANIPRFNITFAILLLIEIVIMVEIQLSYIYIGIGIIISILLGMFIRHFILPSLGRQRISRACEQLIMQERNLRN